MEKKELSVIKDIENHNQDSCNLLRKLIRRVEYMTSQQEMTNCILIEIARSESKEDLNERINNLIEII